MDRPDCLSGDRQNRRISSRARRALEDNPEKVDTGFPSRQTRSLCAEIMLKTKR
jgi:hypothetical protein